MSDSSLALLAGVLIRAVFGAIGAAIAKHKNRSGGAWFAICFVASWIGLLVIVCMRKLAPPLAPANPAPPYNEEKWMQLVASNAEVAAGVEILRPFSERYVIELATALLASSDNQDSGPIVERLLAKAKTDAEIGSSTPQLDHIGRLVDVIYRTSRGMLAQLKDFSVLAQVGEDFRTFGSIEQYRRFYDDRAHWQEVTKPEERRNFFSIAHAPLEQANARLTHGSAPPGDGVSAPNVDLTSLTKAPVTIEQQQGAGDDFRLIVGIDANMKRQLNARGVRQFSQIAAWTAVDIERMDAALGLKGRIEKEDWVGQAKSLISHFKRCGDCWHIYDSSVSPNCPRCAIEPSGRRPDDGLAVASAADNKAPPRVKFDTQRIANSERFVIFASSLGTIFEWYDFYLYAVLAPFFASLFFPAGNDTAALLSAFATYAAGFLVRPFGAIIFGRVGDLVGRKYTFLVTIMVMGASTFAVGLLPTYAKTELPFFGTIGGIGWIAPIVLVTLRLLQGLALGGEYGGAATYVAEHARVDNRGYSTSWIQTTATVGLLLALVIIGVCREYTDAWAFSQWGWRVPFLISLILLVFSVYIRLKLSETPVFQKMREEGKGSKRPLTESFFHYPNNKYVLLALLGATAGQGVVWYTGLFYALFFLTITLKVDYLTAYKLIGLSLIIGTPFFIVFGWLSDRIGRLKIIMAGCLVAALTYFPLFAALTHYANPDLEAFARKNPIIVTAEPATCSVHIFVTAFTKFSNCDRAQDFITKLGLSFKTYAVPGSGDRVALTVGTTKVEGWDAAKWTAALATAGYPQAADPNKINWLMVEAILVIMVIYVTMVYGPIAAFLVELFPTKIRYTSMSLPYHIGNGWFGGMLPLLATALVAATGDIYFGLWYPIIVAMMTFSIGVIFLPETREADIMTGSVAAEAKP